jgi:hypothetical protein
MLLPHTPWRSPFSAFPPFRPAQEKQFFSILGKARPSYVSPVFAPKQSTKQIIVLFRVLRELPIGQNSLHLSGSTGALLRHGLSCSFRHGLSCS